MDIKAIPTRYHGYHFRSRLEARWAVFLDALGLPWEYEPEGFALSDGRRYLPDFRVLERPGFPDVWLEIKPMKKTDDTDPKFLRFAFDMMAKQKNAGFVIAKGEPGCLFGMVLGVFNGERRCGIVEAEAFVKFWADASRATESQMLDAIGAARSARFEHGECGAT